MSTMNIVQAVNQIHQRLTSSARVDPQALTTAADVAARAVGGLAPDAAFVQKIHGWQQRLGARFDQTAELAGRSWPRGTNPAAELLGAVRESLRQRGFPVPFVEVLIVDASAIVGTVRPSLTDPEDVGSMLHRLQASCQVVQRVVRAGPLDDAGSAAIAALLRWISHGLTGAALLEISCDTGLAAPNWDRDKQEAGRMAAANIGGSLLLQATLAADAWAAAHR